MKIATGGDVQRRLIKRSAETTTEIVEESTIELTESSAEATTSKPESETLSDWSTPR